MKRLESTGSEPTPVLFDLPIEGEAVAVPIMPLVPPEYIAIPRRSEAWDDIANHDGHFVVPDDEEQVYAIEAHSPNPTTAREVSRIETNRRFGLTGKVSRTPEQDDNARQAAEQGHEAEELRDIAKGMSRQEARARRIVKAMRRGENTEGLTL